MTNIEQTDPTFSARRASYYSLGYWRAEELWTTLCTGAVRHPDKTAFIASEASITFAALIDDAERLGRGLMSSGVRGGDVVLVHGRNSIETVVALLGCVWAGAVVAGLPPMFSAAQIAAVGDNCAARAIVCLGDLKELREAIDGARECRSVKLVIAPSTFAAHDSITPWEEMLRRGHATTGNRPSTNPDDLALLVCSSGTTGTPKGVMQSANAVRYAIEQRAALHGITHDDVCIVVGQFGFVGNLVFGLLTGVLMNCTTVLMRSWSAEQTLAAIERHKVSYGLFMPTHVHDLLGSPQLAKTDLSHFCHAAMGGLSTDRRQEVRRRLCPNPFPGYGMSECMGNATCSAADPEAKLLNGEGRPYPGTAFRIVDEDDRELPPGQTGRIQVTGPSRCFGYHNAPGLTQEAITADGYFRTGDLGQLDGEGYLTFIGREKEIIRRGSVTIVPVEVEAALLEHPRIAKIAVVALPDPRMGERACACVVTSDGREFEMEEMTAFLAERSVPRYMWPERIERFDALPLTPSLKVKKPMLVTAIIERETRTS